MRIKRCQHAVNRRFYQLFIAHFFNIVGLGAFHNLAEQIKQLVGVDVFIFGRG